MAESILMQGEDSLVHIPLYYRVRKNKNGSRRFQILEDDEGKLLLDKENSDVQCLNTKWKPQTWSMNNNLLKSATAYNQATGSQDIDFTKYQENVFSTCMADWDMVDGKEQPIPVNEQTIGLLPANIAQALIRKYDKSLTLDEEELGK